MPSEFGSSTPPAPTGYTYAGVSGSPLSWAGERVTPDEAAGLPAVFQAIRLVSETVARLPLRVYRGVEADKRAVMDQWQWRLLCQVPNDEQSVFDFWSDVVACVESHGNAYLLKVPGAARTVEMMYVIDPNFVRPMRADELHPRFERNEIFYRLWKDGQPTDYGRSEILHIRGFTLKGGLVGLSPIQIVRHKLGAAMARSRFEGVLYENDATPPGILYTEQDLRQEQALEYARVWHQQHGGIDKQDVAVLGGGLKYQQLSIPLRDAQFIEAEEFSIADIARTFNMPKALLNAGELESTEEDARRFLNFGLSPRLDRIAKAVLADPQLFGEQGELYPEHYTKAFIRPDAVSEAQVRHLAIQDGSLLIDEARAEDGRGPLPPVPDDPNKEPGKVPQITPVGGAPNPNTQPVGKGAGEGE